MAGEWKFLPPLERFKGFKFKLEKVDIAPGFGTLSTIKSFVSVALVLKHMIDIKCKN